MTTNRPAQGWLGPLLLRLHFYAAILVGPLRRERHAVRAEPAAGAVSYTHLTLPTILRV